MACVGGTLPGLLLTVAGVMVMVAYPVEAQQADEKIIVSSILIRPYLSRKLSANGRVGKDRYEGFVVELLDRLTDRAGVDYELKIQDNYGSLMPDGSWNGMIGDVINMEANMSLAPLTESLMRAQVVDFGKHFQSFGRVAIVKKWPRDDTTFKTVSLDIRLGQLFAPLSDSVWLLSGMAWFVASLVLYIICRINPFEWRRMLKDQEATMREGESFNCVNSYWFMLGAIFWQGFMRSPRSMGARIVVTFWWLYALIFVSMYIASLTNYLQSMPQRSVVELNYTRIQTLEDVLDENVKIGVIKNSATESYFKYRNDEFYDKIWTRIDRDKEYARTLEAGIEKVRASTRDEPYVFFGESTMADHLVRQPPCDLYMIPDFPYIGTYAPAFPMGSPLKTRMDKAMYMLKESGYLQRIEKKWFTGECKNNYMDVEDEPPKKVQYPPFQRVDLASFSGALILLIIGLAAGSVVTVIEIFIYRYFFKEENEPEQDKSLMTDKSDTTPNSGQSMSNV